MHSYTLSHSRKIISLVVSMMLCIYSPIFGMVTFLILMKHNFIKNIKNAESFEVKALVFILSLGIAHVVGSRAFGFHYFDDFHNIYWNQFLDLRQNGFLYIFNNNDKTFTSEYLFYLWFYLVGKLNFINQPSQLVFLTVFFLMIFYFNGLIKFSRHYLPSEKRSSFISIVISLSSFGIISQLTRQSISAYIFMGIIFRIYSYNNKDVFNYSSISFLFHVSTLYNFLMLYLTKINFKKIIYIISLITIIYLLYSDEIFNLIISSTRLEYYTLKLYDDDVLDFNYLFLNRVLILSFIIVSALFFKKKTRIKFSKYIYFIFLNVIVFYLTINIPYLAFRLNFISLYILFPIAVSVFFSEVLRNNQYIILGKISILLFLVRSVLYSNRGSFTYLWDSYPPISLRPFVFLF